MYRESEGREDREREKMKELERELVKGEIWEYREIVQRVGLFFFFWWVWGFVNLWRDVTLTKITFILVIIF